MLSLYINSLRNSLLKLIKQNICFLYASNIIILNIIITLKQGHGGLFGPHQNLNITKNVICFNSNI